MESKIINAQATCLNLKKLIEEKGYTPTDIIDFLNLGTVQAVYKWYATAQGKGRCLPSVDNMILLSRRLGVSLDDLYITNDDMPLWAKE
ncbi:MAG: helix-turn-helix domain-containing protein [Lachnospiraceae bacterium]|nr:helix-turn-helix domain-containing protein [Lachnospiraceae bacterium]